MPVAKITGQGLLAIACSVSLLWGCLIGEHVMLRHAAAERARVLRQMQLLQRQPRPIPAGAPMPAGLPRFLVTVG
jgi:hypothetical protein